MALRYRRRRRTRHHWYRRLSALQPQWEAATRKFGAMKVFHFESPKSSELGTPAEEGSFLEDACKISGHTLIPFTPHSKQQFEDQLEYIFSTWEAIPGTLIQFSLHISCHGNSDGIRVGKDSLTWDDLAKILNKVNQKLFDYMLFLSACGGPNLPMTIIFKDVSHPPKWIFSFLSSIGWSKAALSWALFYHWIPEIKVHELDKVKAIIDNLYRIGIGSMRYHRRNGSKYNSFKPRDLSQEEEES